MTFQFARTTLFGVLLSFAAAASSADRTSTPACPLVPVPKFYRDHGRTWQLLGPNQTAIVIGAPASEPERYAAQRLQSHIERRFQRRIPIAAEAAVSEAVRYVFLLGRRSTNAWLDRLCREPAINGSWNLRALDISSITVRLSIPRPDLELPSREQAVSTGKVASVWLDVHMSPLFAPCRPDESPHTPQSPHLNVQVGFSPIIAR